MLSPLLLKQFQSASGFIISKTISIMNIKHPINLLHTLYNKMLEHSFTNDKLKNFNLIFGIRIPLYGTEAFTINAVLSYSDIVIRILGGMLEW